MTFKYALLIAGLMYDTYAQPAITCDESVVDFNEAFQAASPVASVAADVEAFSFVFDGVTRFLGCNDTHFDVLVNNVIDTYTTDIFFLNDPQPENCENGEGQCYYSLCSAASEHGVGGHNHDSRVLFENARLLQHGGHDGDGHNGTMHGNETHGMGDYYMAGHEIVVGHAFTCCSDLDTSIAPHHTCDLASLFNPACSAVTTIIKDAVQSIEFSGVVHPPEHANGFPGEHGGGDDGGHNHGSGEEGGHNHGSGEEGGHNHGGERILQTQHQNAEDYYFVGCNLTHVDLFADRHIYTFALSNLYRESAECMEGDGHGHGMNHTHSDQDHGRLLSEVMGECVMATCATASSSGGHGHNDGDSGHGHEGEGGNSHGYFRRLQQNHGGEVDLDGIDLTVNTAYYAENHELYVEVYDSCCAAVDHGSSAFTCETDVTFENIQAFVSEGTEPEDEDGGNNDSNAGVGVDSEVLVIAVGSVILVGIVGIVILAMIKGDKAKTLPAEQADVTDGEKIAKTAVAEEKGDIVVTTEDI